MVCVDGVATIGTLLAVLVIKTGFASAVLSPIHARALATTSSASDCATSADFCNADATCLACAEAWDASIVACGANTMETCDELAGMMCCASSGCEDNPVWTTYIGCFNAGFDCGVVDSGVVDGGGGGGGSIDIFFSIPPIVYGKNPVASFRPLASQCFNGGFGCGVMDVSACTLGGDSGSDGATTSDPGVTTTDSTIPLDDDTSATTSDRALPTTTDTADSTTPTSSGTSPCQAEANACLADPECTLCIDALDAEEAAIEAICEASDYSGETATCSERSEVMCCYVEEGTDCIVTNAAMVAYVDCAIATLGCDFSLTDCAAGVSSSTLAGGDDATSATTSDRALPTTTDTTDSTATAADDTSSDTAVCQAEQDACFVEGSACLSCFETTVAGASAVEAICQDEDYDAASATCSERSEVTCCSVREGPECLADPDDLLAALIDCLEEAAGCDFSTTDCVDGGDGADGIDADDEQEDTEADAADTDADSATRSAAVRGSTAMLAAAAVSLALMNT